PLRYTHSLHDALPIFLHNTRHSWTDLDVHRHCDRHELWNICHSNRNSLTLLHTSGNIHTVQPVRINSFRDMHIHLYHPSRRLGRSEEHTSELQSLRHL